MGENRASMADWRAGSNVIAVSGGCFVLGSAAGAAVGALHSTKPQVRLKQYTRPSRNLRCGKTSCWCGHATCVSDGGER